MGASSAYLVTLGYEGRTAQEVLGALARLGVDVVVDVRLTPLSRKAGLSKRRLAGAVEALGISYLHLPELGNPRDNREAFRVGEASARSRFRALLRSAAGASAVRRVVELAGANKVALLCYERNPDTCHRHLVAEEARRLEPSLVVEHAD